MSNDLKRVGLVFTQEGAVDFRKTLQEVNIEMNKNYNQFKLTQAQWDESTSKIQKLTEEQRYLAEAYELQEDKVKTLRMQLSDLENAENKNTTAIKKKTNELTNAEIKLQNYKNKLDKVSTSLENTKNGFETTAEKLKRLNNEIKENENKFKLIQSQWNAMTKETEKLKVEQQYLTDAYRLQSEKVNTLKEQLAELENVEDKNTNAISKKKQEIIKAETELNNYNTKLQIVTNQLENFSAKMITAGEKIENVGKKIEGAGKKVSAFSIATGTALLASAKTAIDFEDAFTGVEKTVNGTAEEMAELKQGIRDMAKEIPSTTTEISAVAEAAGQLGIEREHILSFTRTMIDMGNATNLSAEEAATTLARFANITRMSKSDFSKLGSVIVELGNNFATTEAEIAQMGMNLASAGTQVGMTQSEIMALATALSSVGLEAQAGGTAFSKVMVNMQLAVEKGGDSLKDFASVAGMSAKDFKDAFKKDATKAIMKFVEGLSKSDERGKSAIKVLDDMGIKETRLRDALLRSANASDIFSKAIELGNEAWEDNTALTNEANKRYETLKSKIQIAVNKLKDIAITIGNKLMPYVEKLIKHIENLAGWFNKLSDEEVEFIMNIGLAVTAIGPLITAFGRITSIAGGAVKGVGTFVQAIGVMKGKITSSSEAVNGLAKVISAITSPAGLAVIAITALAGAAAYLALKQTDAQKEVQKLAEEVNTAKETMEEYNSSIDDIVNSNMSQIETTEKLKDELKLLVDENGKVKEGYKSRVDFILKQLNDALGKEYKLTGDVIENYQDLRKEIDETIRRKKAEILLSGEEEKYKDAIKNQRKAVENLKKAHEGLGMSIDEARQKYNEWYSNYLEKVRKRKTKRRRYNRRQEDGNIKEIN